MFCFKHISQDQTHLLFLPFGWAFTQLFSTGSLSYICIVVYKGKKSLKQRRLKDGTGLKSSNSSQDQSCLKKHWTCHIKIASSSGSVYKNEKKIEGSHRNHNWSSSQVFGRER